MQSALRRRLTLYPLLLMAYSACSVNSVERQVLERYQIHVHLKTTGCLGRTLVISYEGPASTEEKVELTVPAIDPDGFSRSTVIMNPDKLVLFKQRGILKQSEHQVSYPCGALALYVDGQRIRSYAPMSMPGSEELTCEIEWACP